MKSIFEQFCNKIWFVPSDVLQRSAEAKIWRQYSFKKPILEIVAGDGRMSSMLFRSKKIDVSVDINKEAVMRGKTCNLYKKLIVADARKLPFRKSTFNTVVSNSTLEHINNNEKVVKEVVRVLKSGGVFYFCVPLEKLARFIGLKHGKKNLNFINKRLIHVDYKNTNEWEEVLKRYGLGVIEKIYYLDEKSTEVWYKYLRLFTTKFRGRELWSYLARSRISLILLGTIVSRCFYNRLKSHYKNSISPDGHFIFIKAIKKK